LICDDPDAPTPEPWVHWIFYGIPGDAESLPEGIERSPHLSKPPGAMQGVNSFGSVGYGGPMPPPGHGTHHYHFKLYALDSELDIQTRCDKFTVLKVIEGHILAEAELIGTYERK
jgi:Raf kinase inhibitor-like YbhB/YbcL family protein